RAAALPPHSETPRETPRMAQSQPHIGLLKENSMKKLSLSVCALFLAVSVFAQTADEIVEKHIKAMGGMDKIKAVQTAKATRKVQGQEMETESVIGDYKEVNGVFYPHSIQSHRKGAPDGQGQSITIEKYDLNTKIDNAVFKMPEVKKEEPKADAKKE